MSLPRLRRGIRRLYLCRHGETDFNVQRRVQGSGIDKPLNQNGKAQATHLGNWLAEEAVASGVTFGNISSSSMTRAFQTAEIIRSCQPNTAEIVAHKVEDLVEMNFGELEGLRVDEQDLFVEIQASWARGEFQQWPGPKGESPTDVAERGQRGIFSPQILGSTEHAHVVCVCHGRFNKILLASLGIAGLGSLKDASLIEQDNTCLNVLDYDPASGGLEMVLLNSTKHLPQDFREAELAKRTPRAPR